VTGIRKDAAAEAGRIRVEEPKAAEDRGYYLTPEAFGLPSERGIDPARREREVRSKGTPR
jgi:hypothetical protein